MKSLSKAETATLYWCSSCGHVIGASAPRCVGCGTPGPKARHPNSWQTRESPEAIAEMLATESGTSRPSDASHADVQMTFCATCGNQMSATAAFCTKCGARIVAGSAVRPAMPSNDNLVKCFTCYQVIARNATKCPHCGEPNPGRSSLPSQRWRNRIAVKIILGVIGLFALLTLIASLAPETPQKNESTITSPWSMAWLLAISVLMIVLIRHRSRHTNRGLRQTNRGSGSTAAPSAPSVSVSVTGPGVRSAPDTGTAIAVAGADSWVINPQSNLPLTIHPADGETAYQIKALLDQGGDRLQVNESVRSLMLQKGLRCKEIDDYVTGFRQEHSATIDRLKRESPEWSAASGLDRADLLQEFRTKAVEMLDVSPAAICDVPTLFESKPDFQKVRNLYSSAKAESIKLCELHARYSRTGQKVYHLAAGDPYRRPDFEKLVECGLATRGLEIPISDILNTLTLKDLRAVIADTSAPFFKRKVEAVEYAAKLGDITGRLAKVVAFRELFQLRPLPEKFSSIASELFSEPVMDAKKYAHEAASLIVHTYTMGAYDLRNRSDSELQKLVSGWKIMASDDSCPMCKRAAAKRYPKGARPRVPLHIGCCCNVETKLD